MRRFLGTFITVTTLSVFFLSACQNNVSTADVTIDHIQAPTVLSSTSPSEITITCSATTSEESKVETVTADLSSIGGEKDQVMSKADNDSWLFYGEVQPLKIGNQTITITATDSKDRTASIEWTVKVEEILLGGSDGRFVENFNDDGTSQGTVTDTRTKLTWLKNTDPCDKVNWYEATEYSALLHSGTPGSGLNDGSVAGQWRLATMEELESIGIESPAKWGLGYPPSGVIWSWQRKAPFVITQTGYWASDSHDNPNFAYVVYLYSGCVSNTYKMNFGIWYVLPVRDAE